MNGLKLIKKIEKLKELAVEILPDLEELAKEIEMYRKTQKASTLDERLGSLASLFQIEMLAQQIKVIVLHVKYLIEWKPHVLLLKEVASHRGKTLNAVKEH